MKRSQRLSSNQGMKMLLALTAISLSTLQAGCHDHDAHPTLTQPSSFSAIARGKIEVEGGLLDIPAPENSVFSRVSVHIGDQVKQGQLLAQLDPAAAQLDVQQAQADLAQAKAQQAMQAIHLPAAAQSAQRWEKAAKLGAAQQQQADDAAQALRQAQAENNIALATVHIATEKLSAARYALEKRMLRAPQDAEVIKVNVQTGSTASAEQRVAFTLLPKHPLIVRAEISEGFISRIKLGMQAEISPESAATQTKTVPITAHVIQIGKVYEVARLGNDAPQQNNHVINCLLSIDPQDKQSPQALPLLIGQNTLVKFHD